MPLNLDPLPDIKIDQLIRSRRKTIGLQITRDARLIVRAPYSASEGFIQKIIDQKGPWIRSKQDYFKQRPRNVRKFEPGEEFLFLGRNYALTVADDLPKAVVFNGALMISAVVLANAKDHLECWYKTEALEYFTRRAGHFAQMAGLKYQSIKVSAATTRWGSCGYKDTLNFSWRLMMAPVEVVDYVVIHELMHLKQKNHSRKFWAEVSAMMPDYKRQERWLKENGHCLSF